MEEKLKTLIQSNSQGNRTKWAMKWKNQGKKVIGLLCSYVPEEIIYAADMLPWRVTGTWAASTPHAEAYRISTSCRYCNHALESLLLGEFDFLDGVIATAMDDDIRCLWDVWKYLNKTPLSHMMYLPHKKGKPALSLWIREVRRLKDELERFGGVTITDESICEATEVLNKTRSLLMRVYELKKQDRPPLTGAETLGITTAAAVMSKDEFNQELEAILPYLESGERTVENSSPRLLVSSDMLDDPRYLSLIEDTGALIAMDDMDTGSRYFWDLVESDKDDIIGSIGRRYLNRPGNAHMVDWDMQVDQVLSWVREYNIAGVLELPLLHSFPREFRTPFLKGRLIRNNVPVVSISRDYGLSNVGQLGTRIGAFIEMIQPEV